MNKGIFKLACRLHWLVIVALLLGGMTESETFPSRLEARELTPRPSNAQTPRPGDAPPQPAGAASRANPKDGLKYVWIPPGKFMMGCSPSDSQCDAGERPAHPVAITRGFWMGQTEVTVAAYKRFAAATGKRLPREPSSSGKLLNPGWGDSAMPMVNVTWYEAQAYCSWAGGRLPSESEWEYAARAGSAAALYGGLDQIAWYADNSGKQHVDSGKLANEGNIEFLNSLNDNGNDMHHTALKQPNAFGLFDMLGNVWEWVNDWYDPNYYQHSPSQDPPGPPMAEERVMRGGSWNDFPWVVRVSGRSGVFPAYLNNNLGFRCAGNIFAH